MKKQAIALLTFSTVFFLSGCDPHDSEWFKEHPTEMKEKMSHCSKLSNEEYQKDYECSAAEFATKKSSEDVLNSMEKNSKGL
ncbi:EexN family lipoprotein [Mixta calida]|uniref:EexN family lipoprotein n=1 Tax=Mixta calida TaxID=665913 RepID=UPI001078383F|nr:hypothetical protein [Salmonella enterica subsp. enterica serovar Senftenberg]ELM3915328.1 EexN family lipoprotein [Salmonella enterica subsp. enterica serovar Barranquilla]HBZ5647769.1 EexN family lipoprotein [Salmonella enterica subsp. enterica serovar Goldcoast]EBR9957189.1 hypothetical protein [Salmonella enterica subsp. enterica serovar Senftenberg]ECB7854178.1 hypothetical protein [Salmonella enterica subsp. enterica serovar Senftenberg]